MAPQLDDDLNLDKQGLKSTLLWALLETERVRSQLVGIDSCSIKTIRRGCLSQYKFLKKKTARDFDW